jgi:hypothetical protein
MYNLNIKNSSVADSQLRKVFVGGLPHNLQLHVFKTYFKQFGTIEDIVIL